MKNYLVYINSGVGAEMEIISDLGTYRVMYCNRNTGRRYSRIGNAARFLEKIAANWGPETIKVYGPANDVHVFGGPSFN